MGNYTRPSHRELSPEARKRANCRSYTNELIRRGKLVRGPCEDCGTTEKVQPHHDDYNNPRAVRWKCRDCHRKHHHPERINPLCGQCGQVPRRPGQWDCATCHSAYMVDYRERQKAKRLAELAELKALRALQRTA